MKSLRKIASVWYLLFVWDDAKGSLSFSKKDEEKWLNENCCCKIRKMNDEMTSFIHQNNDSISRERFLSVFVHINLKSIFVIKGKIIRIVNRLEDFGSAQDKFHLNPLLNFHALLFRRWITQMIYKIYGIQGERKKTIMNVETKINFSICSSKRFAFEIFHPCSVCEIESRTRDDDFDEKYGHHLEIANTKSFSQISQGSFVISKGNLCYEVFSEMKCQQFWKRTRVASQYDTFSNL